MDLHDYPRPKGDTGIGVHWNAGFPAVIGLGQIRDAWLPELIAMGIKWVKLARHDGGVKLTELLLKHDIMPIVRIDRPRPNPGTLSPEALRLVNEHVAAGARYFEFNDEPDLPAAWQTDDLPPNAQEIVARNAIIDMEAILERGGYPGMPALSVGSKWDLVGEICRQGRRDLLREPVWQAAHNYSLNHPLDYPDDPGNQQGLAYRQEFYDRLAGEQWEGKAWDNWSLARVNEERGEHCNPGATVFEDPSCWRAYERYDQLIRNQIGRSLPILSTANGYLIGERCDPRYPATTPTLHTAQTLEACRIMMGTSTRFGHAPDYYFCTAFWLLGNHSLGVWTPLWEKSAWYSTRWPGGQLPIVAALKAEPKQERKMVGRCGVAGRISGSTGHGGLDIRLRRGNAWEATARTGEDGRYEFVDLPMDRFTLTLAQTGDSQKIALSPEEPVRVVDFNLTGVALALSNSVIYGRATGGAGLMLQLLRTLDGWTEEQQVHEDEGYRFGELPAGDYELTLGETGVVRSGIVLSGEDRVRVDLLAPTWNWAVRDAGDGPGFGVVRCRVAGRSGLAVRIWTTGWEGMVRVTGQKPEYGADVCEFAPLGSGTFYLDVVGTGARAEVDLESKQVAWVYFEPPRPESNT